jgi:hypothetical protein
VSFLLSEPKYGGCQRLAEVLPNLSHDSVNRFLLRERYEPKDLFEALKDKINLVGGQLCGDDSLIEKPYSDVAKTDLISYFWSGLLHRVAKGIPLITLYYIDPDGLAVPINYRLYDKKEGKTKNQYFREMISEVLSWGVEPRLISADAWYASKANLKWLREKKLPFMMGIGKNRLVCLAGASYVQVHTLDIPPTGLLVHLKQVGPVKVFREQFTNGVERYYIVWQTHQEELEQLGEDDLEDYRKKHWGIECFHRALKQLCGVRQFSVRTTEAIQTHVFSCLCAFCELELMRSAQHLSNWYGLERQVSLQGVRQFIATHRTQHRALLLKLQHRTTQHPYPVSSVNA